MQLYAIRHDFGHSVVPNKEMNMVDYFVFSCIDSDVRCCELLSLVLDSFAGIFIVSLLDRLAEAFRATKNALQHVQSYVELPTEHIINPRRHFALGTTKSMRTLDCSIETSST